MKEFVFESIHELLKNRKYRKVLDLIYDQKLDKINAPYSNDLNHSWYIVGDIYYKSKKYGSSIYFFKKSLEAWPDDMEAILALANSYSETKLYQETIKILKLGLRQEPENEIFIYNIANAWFDLEQYEKAIKMYKKISKKCSKFFPLAKKNIKSARKNKKLNQ